MFSTPILFVIFNRHKESLCVFDKIREIKPQQLFISSDGPRNNVIGEGALCQKLRSEILNKIDWNCNVNTLFHEKNIGCFKAVSSALKWFFQNVEEGIILEDDCVPDISFFNYCKELLEYYRNDTNIWSISGSNFGYEQQGDSYGVTRYMNMWGWATWKRVYDLIDYDMTAWKELEQKRLFLYSRLKNSFIDTDGAWLEYWINIFNRTSAGYLDTWDYQWLFAQLFHKKLSVFPNVNLVANIGFNSNATHTVNTDSYLGGIAAKKIDIPLSHPKMLKPNILFEENYVKQYWCSHQAVKNYYPKLFKRKMFRL